MAGDPDAGWPWLSRRDLDDFRADVKAFTKAVHELTAELQSLVRIIVESRKPAPEGDTTPAARITLHGI